MWGIHRWPVNSPHKGSAFHCYKIIIHDFYNIKMEIMYSLDNNCVMLSKHISLKLISTFNTLRPRQNGRHFSDDIFDYIFLDETVCPINNILGLVQIMAWRRPGDKPLFEPMMVILLTHICVTGLNELIHYAFYKLSYYTDHVLHVDRT